MSIAKRRINNELSVKVQQYLQKAAMLIEPNVYFYNIELADSGKDEGVVLDARIRVDESSLAVLNIWKLEYDHTRGMPAARSLSGEKGVYAKILAEKYFNHFFDYLETVGIDNCDDKENFVSLESVE